MSNGDSGMPKPDRVEVGQRWRGSDAEWIVSEPDASQGWWKVRSPDGRTSYAGPRFFSETGTFLGWAPGYGPETSGGGVAVGTKLTWCKSQKWTLTGRNSDGSWRATDAYGFTGGRFTEEMFKSKHCQLLPSTPAPPGLEGPEPAPKRTRAPTLREVMETRYPDRCQWFTYSTPGGVGKQCEMTHSGPRSPYCEAHVFEAMEARRVAAAPSKPIPPAQSHCLGAGCVGVWNLRGGR